jgi:hypothetical protein
MTRAATWLLYFVSAIVIAHIAWYGSHPYLIDIIGRTNMVSALELAAGNPIYVTPAAGGAVSMGYTPGFSVLGSTVFQLFGFSRGAWSLLWVSIALFVLIVATSYLLKYSRWFAILVPAGMLGCLFPVVWARGDMAAIGLFWLGWVLLDPLARTCERNYCLKRLAFAALVFSFSAFFKQTTLPAIFIAGAIWALERTDTAWRHRLLYFAMFSITVAALFAAMLAAYILHYDENVISMIEVLTLGKAHGIDLRSFIQYLVFYAVATALPTLVVIKHVRSALSIIFLHLVGVSFLLYAAKIGGGFHHFLILILPWSLSMLPDRSEARDTVRDLINILPALVVCIIGFVLMFRPSIAQESDVLAAESLSSVLAAMDPSRGEILILDSVSNFAFVDAVYSHGFNIRWDRGALEEWSFAMQSIPTNLVAHITMKYFQRIVVRGSGDDQLLPHSNYGVSYDSMNDAIARSYILCSGSRAVGWVQYCPL